jgi:hypothetical protein
LDTSSLSNFSSWPLSLSPLKFCSLSPRHRVLMSLQEALAHAWEILNPGERTWTLLWNWWPCTAVSFWMSQEMCSWAVLTNPFNRKTVVCLTLQNWTMTSHNIHDLSLVHERERLRRIVGRFSAIHWGGSRARIPCQR